MGRFQKIIAKSLRCHLVQAFAIMMSVIFVASCDIAYSPMFCNGFEETVNVTVVWQGSDRRNIGTLNSSECKALDVSLAYERSSITKFTPVDGYGGAILIHSISGHLMGRYEVPTNTGLWAMGHSPNWLISEEGFFHIAHDLESDWRNNVPAIQKRASLKLSNSVR